MTVELSYPEFKDRQPRAIHHSRGGYYKNWLEQHPNGWRHGGSVDNTAGDNENDDEGPPEREPEEEEGDIDPVLKDKGKEGDKVQQQGDDEKASEDGEHVEDIQILDLHSKRPIIAYKGRTFEGQWAEIIGTEAIFTNRDSENPLPALRQLDGNVDLLAASASRILTSDNVLKPKVSKEDPLAAIREEWNIRIPVGKDKSGERALQTRFLENLIALKKKKGESDQVTVYAKDGENKNFKDTRDPDYKPRRRRRIFDENGQEVFPQKPKPQRGRRRMGRPKLHTGRDRGSAAGARHEGTDVFGGSSVLSTPTPMRWMDLDDKEDKDDEEENEDDESDDEEDEDITMAD